MPSKIATEKEFNNIYFRTGKDPDNNDMPEIVFGGKNDSYNKYILKKQAEEQKSANRNICLGRQIKFKNAPQAEQLYIWRSMDDDRVRPTHQEMDDEIFDWNDDAIKPGEDYGCRCYAEFLDDDENPSGEYGRIAWPDKEIESDPKPYYEPCDKNGTPLNEKEWRDLTSEEKELRKQEELEKFKNSDRLRDNIKKAEEIKYKLTKEWWFFNQVKPGGPWDYKKDGHPEMEHVGNFNYGATGSAAGFSNITLKLGGHGAQIGTSFRFDDPVDQKHIQYGIDWYNDNY